MKRVAVIAIFMAVMASLFAFPVFADTPIQPLQVITYSDTTTNVRISGTAERLHYNVDSFQVVFMNPPNNYGTACTPVLISFRFYNASDIPAYVGQPEFELTATSGTGAVNTIIYGYDQISTDLFVAESSYSTAEVGRIGIGASNDFAYYTGFVIPPRTSLYFSCIVYVNASAYAQNNTGATEDVNQVTLSTLNLYTNQISFSADYPYHNEPVDFSSIIEAIESLSDNVSTSAEMQQIINLLSYSGASYVPTILSGANKTVISTIYDPVQVTIIRNVGRSYYIQNDIELNNSSDTIVKAGTLCIPLYCSIKVNNYSNNQYQLRYNFNISNLIPNGCYSIDVPYSVGVGISDFYINDYLTMKLQFNYSNPIGYNAYLQPNSARYINFIINCYINDTQTLNYSDPTIDYFTAPIVNNNIYAPSDIYYVMRDLYIAYSSVNGLDDIDNTSDDIKDKSESAHSQEQSYFTQNAQAIQQTGLNNYRFNGDQENGIGSISHDFTLLWNALGGFNSIYIFSLTLSLALMILRHAPGVIRSSRRNKDE